MTGFWIGCLWGYIVGNLISDGIWKKRFEELDEQPQQGEWEEVIPKKHIRRRRYS
jgi:F420-0:gamma-glutamyl ligase-like protein